MSIIRGNELDNFLIGTAEIDQMYGLEGNDILDGREGGDFLLLCLTCAYLDRIARMK